MKNERKPANKKREIGNMNTESPEHYVILERFDNIYRLHWYVFGVRVKIFSSKNKAWIDDWLEYFDVNHFEIRT